MPGRPRESPEADANTSLKKQKTERKYVRGAITKVRVHNFMTYKDADIVPGPSLNLVLGPNGTGKSSLVNAICIGLAGPTQLLGRADNVRDFVRRGANEGFVQIWLSTGDPSRPLVIKRNLNANQNSSDWRINGAIANLRDVKEKVKDFNIQLDNLCQFLPQDKVVEFAKLKPGQLLEETEMAVKDSSLQRIHKELIDKSNSLKVIESAAEASKDELQLLEKANQELKRDVHRFELKAQLEAEMKAIEDKLVWTRFKDSKTTQKELLHQYEVINGELKILKAKEAKLAKPRKEKLETQQGANKASSAALTSLRRAEENTEAAKKSIDELVEMLEDQHLELEGLAAAHTAWENEVLAAKAELEGLEADCGRAQAQHGQSQAPDHAVELRRLYDRRRDALSNITTFSRQHDELQATISSLTQESLTYHEQVRKLSSVKTQRLQHLEQYSPGIGRLARWLEVPEVKTRFRGQVYGPLLCEVEIDNDLHASYLEQHCPRSLWARFVTEFREDQDLLARESRQRFNFQPIVTNFTGNVAQQIRHPLGEASEYSSHGVTHTLDAVFSAPPLVKLMMEEEAALGKTYCGTQRTDGQKFLEENPAVQRLLTPESQFITSVSAYNASAKTSTLVPLRSASLLAVGRNRDSDQEKVVLQAKIADIVQKTRELQEQQKELDQAIKEKETEVTGWDTQIRQLQSESQAHRQRLKTAEMKVKLKKNQIVKLRARPDPLAQTPKLQADIQKTSLHLCSKMEEIVGIYSQLPDMHKSYAVAEAVARELQAQARQLEQQEQEASGKVQQAEAAACELGNQIRSSKATLQKLRKDAEARTGPMRQAVKDAFAGLVDGKEGLEAALSAKQAEVDAVEVANPGVMEEYNQRRARIDSLSRGLADQQESLALRHADLQQQEERWLGELRQVVAEINSNFGRSFQRIGCAGEVSLHEVVDAASGKKEYEKFAIHIKVRFRAEEDLQLLTAHRQSGGERSVSTILYLLAIQSVTVCPFRVVDEINQGMDPLNERKVFMQLVEAACKPDTPQCFLLTPKLLPNLPFSPDVTILEIYNGALVSEAADNFQLSNISGLRPKVWP